MSQDAWKPEEVRVMPLVKSVTVSSEQLKRLEAFAEAWRFVCDEQKRLTGTKGYWEDADSANLWRKVEEMKLLYGDPNVPSPQGTITARTEAKR